MTQTPIQSIQDRFDIVGRAAEIDLCLACLDARRNLMLEGPVGVGKSVLAEALASHLGRNLFRADGDERYTEMKMTGWYDPSLVLKGGYVPEYFVKGPLALAMETGGVLFVNEINRMPEAVQNVLLPAMEERRVVIPQFGEIQAHPEFLVVATQNPVEFVATSHLSEALVDRFEFVRLDYQSGEEEIEIVRRRTGGDAPQELIAEAVALVQQTRRHPKIRRGASVRAAIGLVEVARRLGGGEGALRRAASVTLLHRLEVQEEGGQSAEAVLDGVLDDHEKKKRASLA